MRTQNSAKNYVSAKVTSDAFIAPPAEGNNIFRLVEMIRRMLRAMTKSSS